MMEIEIANKQKETIMNRNLSLIIYLTLFFALFLCTSAFGARIYDDFSGTYIDGQTWNDRELVREIVVGKLISKVGNSTTSGYARNTTAFKNPSTIDIIQSDITVVETVLDTGNNPQSFARIDGRFYNTKAAGGATGDIWAGVFLGDRGNGLEAWWEVYESLDDPGSNWEEKGSGPLIGPGTLTYGTAYTAKLAYDGTNGFTFTVHGQNATFNGPARQRDAVGEYKGLITGAYADGGSGTGNTSVLFDNVFINNQATVYDDFSTAPLNQTKWNGLEVVREISGGKLRMNFQAGNNYGDVSIRPNDQSTKYLEAKVAILSGSQLPAGVGGHARLGGKYYNDSRGPGSGIPYNGSEGDVWAETRLVLSNNNLIAHCQVFRSDTPDWSNVTVLFNQVFAILIEFDTEYTLSIEQGGKHSYSNATMKPINTRSPPRCMNHQGGNTAYLIPMHIQKYQAI